MAVPFEKQHRNLVVVKAFSEEEFLVKLSSIAEMVQILFFQVKKKVKWPNGCQKCLNWVWVLDLLNS